jgi:multisubunit Na+/H+ antiporter MnhF subunit
MADMSAWLIAAVAFLPAVGVAVIMCARGNLGERLAAAQLASSLAVLLLVILTFALDQASSMDLALTLALLSLPATLLYALFVERWL